MNFTDSLHSLEEPQSLSRAISPKDRDATSIASSRIFLSNALGSLMEVETQLLIAKNLGYGTSEHTEQLLAESAELGKILNGLAQSIRARAAGS